MCEWWRDRLKSSGFGRALRALRWMCGVGTCCVSLVGNPVCRFLCLVICSHSCTSSSFSCNDGAVDRRINLLTENNKVIWFKVVAFLIRIFSCTDKLTGERGMNCSFRVDIYQHQVVFCYQTHAHALKCSALLMILAQLFVRLHWRADITKVSSRREGCFLSLERKKVDVSALSVHNAHSPQFGVGRVHSAVVKRVRYGGGRRQ